MRALEVPELPAVIRLDGTSDGGFLHLLGEVAPDDVRIGMEVEAVWQPAGERAGRSWTSRTSGRGSRSSAASSSCGGRSPVEVAREPRPIPGELSVSFRYTPGVGNTAFFEALRDRGVFLGSRCDACGFTYLPARLFCERCLAELEPTSSVARRESSCRGRSPAWTSTTVRSTEPVTYGLVRLDGADTVLLHRLIDWRRPGDRRCVSRGAGTRADGSILDIEGFAPMPG